MISRVQVLLRRFDMSYMNSFSIWWNHPVTVLHLPIYFSLSSEKCWNGQKVHIDAKCINILFIIWSLLFYVYMEKNILTLMAGWRGVLLRGGEWYCGREYLMHTFQLLFKMFPIIDFLLFKEHWGVFLVQRLYRNILSKYSHMNFFLSHTHTLIHIYI